MKIRIKFSKQGAVKFIGHLDILRYFQKAMRRADVDMRYSEGFSPHQIMSFAAPLGVGLTSDGEYVDIEVLSTGSSSEMVSRLNEVMADGIEILSYKRLPDDAENAMSLVAACDYTVRFREGYDSGLGLSDAEFFQSFAEFLKRGNSEDGSLMISKKTKKGEKRLDLKPLIYEMEAGQDSCFLKLAAGSTNNIKPELVLEAFYADRGIALPPFAFQINRKEVYADQGEEGAHAFRALEAFGEDIE